MPHLERSADRMTYDRYDQLTTIIGHILDGLEKNHPTESRSKALNDYIRCCRQFIQPGPIADYPDWLLLLRSHSNAIAPAAQFSRTRELAQAVAKLIEDTSYGEPEDKDVAEANRILNSLNQSTG